MTSGDIDKMGIDNIDDMIDSAIDDLFVPGGGVKKEEPVAAKEEEAETTAATPAPEAEESNPALEMEISWESAATTEPLSQPEPTPEPDIELAAPLEAAEEIVEEPSFELPPEEFGEIEHDEQTSAPKLPILRPLYERMLTLDWEINKENIVAFEDTLDELGAQTMDNMHAQNAIKMSAVCCKYLRASKTLASPLALKFLRSVVSALNVFLQPPAPGLPSKDALVNELMGLYNDMKEDANRLRAAALRRRQSSQAETQAPQPAAEPVAPVAPLTPPAAAPSLSSQSDIRAEITFVKKTLEGLLKTINELEAKL